MLFNINSLSYGTQRLVALDLHQDTKPRLTPPLFSPLTLLWLEEINLILRTLGRRLVNSLKARVWPPVQDRYLYSFLDIRKLKRVASFSGSYTNEPRLFLLMTNPHTQGSSAVG